MIDLSRMCPACSSQLDTRGDVCPNCGNLCQSPVQLGRPGKDEYFMQMVRDAGARGTCDRGKSGAVLTDADGVVVGTGYVGAARGLPHCDEAGHMINKVTYEDGTVHEHCVRTAHAEGNAIVQVARRIVKGGTMYCKMEPCLRCTVDIINAGIKRVVAEYRYHGAATSREWLKQAGVELVVLHDEELSYNCHDEEGEEEPGKCTHVVDELALRAADGAKGIIDLTCIKCGTSGSFRIPEEDIQWE